MRVKINFVFFVCYGSMAILARAGKNYSNTENRATSTKQATILDSTNCSNTENHGTSTTATRDSMNCSSTEYQDTSTKQPTIPDSTQNFDYDELASLIKQKSNVTQTGFTDFAEIRYRRGFRDNSRLIEAIFCGCSRFILRARRRTGKSVNISMLKRFFEIPPDEAALRANRKLFEGLRIEKSVYHMKEHFGKHPVLFLDFKRNRSVDSHIDAFQFFRDVVHNAYKSHAYLLNSKWLDDYSKRAIREWLDDGNYRNSQNTDKRIFRGYRLLTRYLFEHNRRRVFVLVDEYDSVWRDYVHLQKTNTTTIRAFFSEEDRQKLKGVAEFCTALLRSFLINNDELVEKAFLTGTYSLHPLSFVWAKAADMALRNVWNYNAHGNRRFSKFFRNYTRK